MKLTAINSNRPRSRSASVVLVLLIFLTLMVMLCSATWTAVHLTRQEIGLIEKHQKERLATTTNAPPTSTKSVSTP